MRVLIFSLAYHPMIGGAEVAVKEITDRLPEIEFDMVTKRFDSGHPAEEKIGNVNVHRIKSSKAFFPINAYLVARSLHRENHYDAIWSIMAAYAGFGALFFKMSYPKVPFILNLQEGDSLEHIKKRVGFLEPLFKKIFIRADKIQAISTFLAKWAKEMGYRGEVEVIPNGVNAKKFENLNPKASGSEIILITTSRLVEKNGVGDVIEALEYLPESVRFKILGVGPLDKELREKVRKIGLQNRVDFLGFVPQSEIPKHLHEADIFVRPSLSEGMGNSFIEAMAAGLPVIATPVGGITDFLKDGETGLFCKVGDPKSIAEKVMEYVNNPELKKRIVNNAKEMVAQKYDWDLIAREMKSRVFNL